MNLILFLYTGAMASAPDELIKLFEELRDRGERVQFHVAQWLVRVMISKDYNLSIYYREHHLRSQFETRIYTNDLNNVAVVQDDKIGYGNGWKQHKDQKSIIDELRYLRTLV